MIEQADGEYWNVAEAKARFSELIDAAEQAGPQTIRRRGREVVVVVPIDEWHRKATRSGSLAQFLAESPLRDSGLEAERVSGTRRDVEL